MRIRGAESGRYLCMNRKGKLVGKVRLRSIWQHSSRNFMLAIVNVYGEVIQIKEKKRSQSALLQTDTLLVSFII